jgi:hypothetical protein
MSQDLELQKQRMLKAQEAILGYAHETLRNPVRHTQLIQELHQATKDFVDCVERLTKNPPSRLVPD